MEIEKMNKLFLSIIIPLYNPKLQDFRRCIMSIKEINIPHEIIIIDDGSTDNISYLCEKFIENKKQQKAVLSFLVNNTENGKNYFEYNIYKYEKHPSKGTMMLKYATKYFCTNNNEITQIGNKIREENDIYMEKLITSPIPPIIEKEIK